MKKNAKRYITAALFAAMTCVLTFMVRVPAPVGFTHPGDSVIYLAACILPFPYTLAAAAVGGALADLLAGYPQFIVPTLIIKSLMSLLFSCKSEKILTKRNALVTIPSGLMLISGYFIATWAIYDLGLAFAGIPGDLMQSTMSAVMFIAVAAGLDKIKFKQRLELIKR
ncbi:MAG: TIGR04002 family protein [Oscillospiraceae bacterium]|nr:TIGR04002 family protein [Oscillospiraceae bacterium]